MNKLLKEVPEILINCTKSDPLWIFSKDPSRTISVCQNVSVDEAIVKGKGRNHIKQYMPAKPIKR